MWDEDGQRLLDFTSQLVFTNLGHQHPRIVSRDPGAGGVPVHGRPAARQRRALGGRAADRQPHAG